MSLGLLTRYGLTRAPVGGGGVSYFIEAFGTLSANSGYQQVGVEYQTVGALTLAGIRIYLGANSADETLRLWRSSDTTVLATITGVDGVADTWVEAMFDTPVELAAGTNYVLTTQGAGAFSNRWYSGAKSSATISSLVTFVRGRFGTGTGFPSTTNTNNMYGLVDGIVQT